MKTLKILLLGVIISLTVGFLSSCSKDEGFGGDATISGKVTYPGGVADGAVVKIAFGTKDATTVFDHSVVTDENGFYEFGGLEVGDYFIDAEYIVFYDNFSTTFNTAGYAVTLEDKNADETLDIELK